MKSIKLECSQTIFDPEIINTITENLNKDEYWPYHDYDSCLTILINPQQISKDCLNNFNFSFYRIWHNNYPFNQKLEIAFRIIISQIKEEIEYFHLGQIYLKSDEKVKNTSLELTKMGIHDFSNKKKNQVKIHLNINLTNGSKLYKIVDLIEYEEYKFFIDERNNNKNLFNDLLIKKEQGETLDLNDLTSQDWQQLILKEKIISKDLAKLYETTEKEVNKQRKKFIRNIKQYSDEYLFYLVMFVQMVPDDYYSNFTIPLLEQMKKQNVKVIYEYLNEDYHELFNVENELKRQKEIERNNRKGHEYQIPLSGVLLKKLYWAIKNNQLDRKILKNNWFLTYYGPMFLKTFLEHIEECHILDLYENGQIYEHPAFKPYPELYKLMTLEETDKLPELRLTKMKNQNSQAHIKKKRKRIIAPRDHIELAIKRQKVGRKGEELAYDYEYDTLKDYPELQAKIEKTYLIDESAGYDLKSYDFDGNPIFIEVKTNNSSSKKRINFFISDTENAIITGKKNAYIYYIYDLKNPKLRIIDQKEYLSYEKTIKKWEIDQEIIES